MTDLNPSPIQLKTFTGEQAKPFIPELARLRINVFREYPYLYDGSMAYEKEYLQTYMRSSDSIVVIAFDGDKVVGASTAMPMEHETSNVIKPWLEQGVDPKDMFYFGESVLLQPYRGQGVGVGFFRHREQWAASLGRFSLLAFCAVIRPDDHPLKPANYTSLESFWQRRGFKKAHDIVCNMSWKDLDQPNETDKQLQFWMKNL